MEIGQKNINIHDYIRVILKHQWTILTIFAVIVVSVVIFSFTATPIYKATTRIIIEKENPKVVSFQEVMSIDSSGMDYYQTQYKLIESRAVANEVIKRLKLDQNEEFVPKPGFFSDIWETVISPITYVKSLLKTETPVPSALEEGLVEPYSPLVDPFIKQVKVSPIRNSRLVDLSFEAKDPVLAAKIANTVARAYIHLSLQTKLKATSDAVNWLNQQVEQEKKKVEQAEQALLKYKQQQGIVTDFSSNVETITAQKLAELNKQVVDATSRRVEAETRFRQAKNLEHNLDSMGSIPEVLQNLLIQDIKKQEVELHKRLSEFSKRYGANHPQIIALNNELKTLNGRKMGEIQRVVNALQNEYRVALAKEQSLKGALGQQKGETLSMNEKAIDYNVLKREAETSREMFDVLIKRFKETSMTEDIRTGNIRIVDPAEIPKSPVKPKKTQNILLAIVVGLSMGVGLAFFLEYIDSTIKLPDEVSHLLKVPYLGPVPALASEAEAEGKEAEKKPEDDLISHFSPKSTASESYRGIRTALLLSSADRPPQVILVCSSAPREGKTITSANIAITMAQAGGKILVLDCDMRRPKLHKLFGTDRDKGMSNILAGFCGMDEAVVHTHIPNVDIIPSGPIPPNPSEILSSHHMKELIEQARTRYERIIIDSPPITAVTDAVILSSFADGVVIVIRAGETHREIIRNGIAQLKAVNAHILGAVLNGVEMGRDSYYYYQYYYYYYGEDGEKRKKTRPKKKAVGRYGEAIEATKDYGGRIKKAWMKEQGENLKRVWINMRRPRS
ncbi:MAG: polysaccharide biosynthesis tyrosine autokinase [Deltaproteobacteria bacterium]|nr:polysaccharide biosynthesis tyrosine autokinase [Deltaproteobacteria bacterium]